MPPSLAVSQYPFPVGVAETEDVLDAAKQGVVVVRRVSDRAGVHESRQDHCAHATTTGTTHARGPCVRTGLLVAAGRALSPVGFVEGDHEHAVLLVGGR